MFKIMFIEWDPLDSQLASYGNRDWVTGGIQAAVGVFDTLQNLVVGDLLQGIKGEFLVEKSDLIPNN